MPPKAKAKKSNGKKSKEEGPTKGDLEKEIVALQEELCKEREEKQRFQSERDKVLASWDTSKKILEETKAKLRKKSREREAAKERQRVEMNAYKQKFKNVLFERHNATTQLKMDTTVTASQMQKQHADSELHLLQVKHGLHADLRARHYPKEALYTHLQLNHKVEQRIKDIEKAYNDWMHSRTKEQERKRIEEDTALEQEMKVRIQAIEEEHKRVMRGEVEEYERIEGEMDMEHKRLWAEVEKVKMKLNQVEQRFARAEKKNIHLREALHEAEQKLPKMKSKLEEHDKAKAKNEALRVCVEELNEEKRSLKIEHNLLLTAFEKVEQERDELLKMQTQTILDIQQKNSLKEMMRQDRLKLLIAALEKEEAQLCAGSVPRQPRPC